MASAFFNLLFHECCFELPWRPQIPDLLREAQIPMVLL